MSTLDPSAPEAKTAPCPSCGKPLPDFNDTAKMRDVWLLNGRFYCQEQCARRAAGA